jgi:hypothetical protein
MQEKSAAHVQLLSRPFAHHHHPLRAGTPSALRTARVKTAHPVDQWISEHVPAIYKTLMPAIHHFMPL